MSESVLQFPSDFLEVLVESISRRTAELLSEQGTSSPWLTTREAAEYLRIPLGRMQNLSAAGAIPKHPQGKAVVFHREDLDAFLRSTRT